MRTHEATPFYLGVFMVDVFLSEDLILEPSDKKRISERFSASLHANAWVWIMHYRAWFFSILVGGEYEHRLRQGMLKAHCRPRWPSPSTGK